MSLQVFAKSPLRTRRRGSCMPNIAGPLQAARTVEGATDFDLGDEHVVLLPSSVTVHFRKAESDIQVLTKIAGSLLTHGAVLDYYRSMLPRSAQPQSPRS